MLKISDKTSKYYGAYVYRRFFYIDWNEGWKLWEVFWSPAQEARVRTGHFPTAYISDKLIGQDETLEGAKCIADAHIETQQLQATLGRLVM